MGKRYRGKLCAYCAKRVADTDEHIFCRQFFTVVNRADLPKAPACRLLQWREVAVGALSYGCFAIRRPACSCDRDFGKHGAIAAGQKCKAEKATCGPTLRCVGQDRYRSLGQDHGLAVRQCKAGGFISRMPSGGFCWHHWSLYLPEDSFVPPMCITAAGERVVDIQLSLNARARVSESLGNGTIDYRGARGSTGRKSAYGTSSCMAASCWRAIHGLLAKKQPASAFSRRLGA